MTRFVDSIIAFRILRMMTTPFEDTQAFRLGIIDNRGKELKKMRQLNTVAERDSYTILHRMIYRLKRIIEKVPTDNRKLLSFAAALSLIKEHANDITEPINLESLYLSRLSYDLTEDINFIKNYNDNKVMLPFRAFIEEAPANNAQATPGVDGLGPDVVVVRRRKKVLRRNEI